MEKEYKILILEDVPADAELMERELRHGGLRFTTQCVQTRDDFSNALEKFVPDLILSDYSLPHFDGLSALAIAHEKHPDTPFIFVTGAMGDELAVETLKKGAVDYLLKNKLAQLVPAVKRAFRNVTSIAKEKEVERTKTDFITLASHQLRTPLSGTKWLIETLRREIAGPVTVKQKEYIDQIDQINERMIKLVSGILNARGFESSASMMKKETISVFELYEKVSQMMEFPAKAKGVHLQNSFKEQKKITIESDGTMIASILETFIENAVDYSENGQEIVLDAKVESGDVIFSVKDGGIGIPKEEHKRISERFYRAGNAKTVKPDGTGLALYVAYLLAKKIGGKISFESEESAGTTFFLRMQNVIDSG